MSKPPADEPEDPRVLMQRQAQEMAQQLMRTVDLPAKLGWTEFDFGVDLFDPLLDDFEGVVASGQRDNETLHALCQIGIMRHVTLAMRHGLATELASRIGNDVRLDVRQEAAFVLRALHQLTLPPASIGLVWALYPRHMMARLRERHATYQREDGEMSAEEHALASAPDVEALRKLGARALPVVDRAIRQWTEKPLPSADVAREVCVLAAQWPGLRMARTLTTTLWKRTDASIIEAARGALRKMPDAAREILELDLTLHDPPPEVRRAMYPVLVDAKSALAVPRMVEDAGGAGAWSKAGKGADHARTILKEIVRAGDRRVAAMLLLVLSVRPPQKDVRAAIVSAMAASPLKAEFERGLKALESGKPVVVTRGTAQEEFLSRYGKFTERMRPEKFQAEVQRVTRLWEECYHEDLGWRTPREMAEGIGKRERDLRQQLEKEVKGVMGRLAGRTPAAALESEFRTKWLVTPHNDVSGRVPLAIILDERASHWLPHEIEEDRRQQSAELYGLAVRAVEGGIKEDAERCLRAILQIMPGHPFAKDALERLERGDGLPGVGTSAAPATDAPRIIVP